MPQGLPFADLSEKPAQDALLASHEQFLEGLKAPDSRRGWIEPNWDAIGAKPAAPAAPAAPTGSSDPFEVAATLHKTQADALTQARDTLLGELDKRIAPKKQSLMRDYEIDRQFINGSKLDAEQKAEKLRHLDAQYQKKLLATDDEVREERDAVTQKFQMQEAEAQVRQLAQQVELQTYRKLVEAGKLDAEDAREAQFKTLGMPYQRPKPKPEPAPTPRDQLKVTAALLARAERERSQYRLKPGKETYWGLGETLPPSGAYLKYIKPAGASTGEWVDVPQIEADYVAKLDQQIAELAPLEESLVKHLTGSVKDYTYNLGSVGARANGTRSPLAQSIPQPKPQQAAADPNDLSELSDTELDALIARTR
jgi:hypothetical protein